MLTYTDLVTLERSLRETLVLSVYLDGTADDFAEQRAWRTRLDHSLKDLRSWLADSSHAEREMFERCVAYLEKELTPLSRGVGSRGWVAFITGEGVRHAGRLPVPMPTMAVWSTGPSVASYIRALKQTRPVVVIVADARKAALYRYDQGALERVHTIHAHAVAGPAAHMGDAPRIGFHPGVRGTTGSDAAQRSLLAGTNRMFNKVADEAVKLAGADGWILTGGIPHASADLVQLMAHSAPGRVSAIDSLDIHASEAEIAAAAEQGASALRDASDLAKIEDIIGRADGDGFVALGPVAARDALDHSSVRELYMTHSFIEDHSADAEDIVRKALAQGALVEEVSREAAQRLKASGGMAARLRYRRPAPATTTSEPY
jgi:Bacterial archaeo-eukaryotic release factor family 10